MSSTTFWQDPTHATAFNTMGGKITSFTSLAVDQGCYMAVLFSHSIGFRDRVKSVKQRYYLRPQRWKIAAYLSNCWIFLIIIWPPLFFPMWSPPAQWLLKPPSALVWMKWTGLLLKCPWKLGSMSDFLQREVFHFGSNKNNFCDLFQSNGRAEPLWSFAWLLITH